MQSSKGANNTQLRLYAGSTLTISSTNTITKIIFNCTASGTSQYGPGNISGTGYSYSGNAGTWTGTSTTISLSVDAQTRCTSIVATYSGGTTTYTVTYDANGGSGTMADPNSYAAGATVTTLTNTFTRSGYVFSKWNTQAGGGGTNYNQGATFTINANTTLYAQWDVYVPPVVDCDGDFYDFSFSSIGDWESSYTEHTLVYANDSIIFISANKQSSNQEITDIPVTKGSDIIVKARDGKKISSIDLTCRQWTTKAQTIALRYSTVQML